METKGETRKWMHVRAPPLPHDGVGGHSSAVVRVQKRSTPPSPWHPPPLIGRRCSGGALQTQTGMCEWAQCLLWSEPRRLFVEVGGVKNKATIIHHSTGQLVRLSGNEIFWTVTESVLKPSAQKARNHFCVFYIYIFLTHGWRGAGRRSETPLRSRCREVFPEVGWSIVRCYFTEG